LRELHHEEVEQRDKAREAVRKMFLNA
jgi:hypothetical protein